MSCPLICVFAGARPARDPAHADAAREVVEAAAARGIGFVYGGGGGGMMGAVADAARAAGSTSSAWLLDSSPTGRFSREA